MTESKSNPTQEGAELFGKKDFKGAEIKLREALRLEPGSKVAIFNVGMVLEELKEPRAEDYYLIAAAMGSPEAMIKLGMIYEAEKRKEEAIRYLQMFSGVLVKGQIHEEWQTYATEHLELLTNTAPVEKKGKILQFPSPKNKKK